MSEGEEREDDEGKERKGNCPRLKLKGERRRIGRWSALFPLGCHISLFPERKGSFVLSRTFPLSPPPAPRVMYTVRGQAALAQRNKTTFPSRLPRDYLRQNDDNSLFGNQPSLLRLRTRVENR